MNFDPRVQVRATYVKEAHMTVSLAPYALAEPLAIAIGVARQWRHHSVANAYIGTMSMQLVITTTSGTRVAVAETTLEQLVDVTGYAEEALTEVLEVLLPSILLPYARAQIAALLLSSGYHTVTLPAELPAATNGRATQAESIAADAIDEVAA